MLILSNLPRASLILPRLGTALLLSAVMCSCQTPEATKPAGEVRAPASPDAVRAQSAANAGTALPQIKGYQTVVRNGEVLYCRAEITTGSVMRTDVCRTAYEIEAEKNAAQDLVDRQRRGEGRSSDLRATP